MTPVDLYAAIEAVKSGAQTARELGERSLACTASAECEHAFVLLDHDPVRKLALAVDDARGNLQLLPRLAGLAVSVKDLYDVEGQVTTAGSQVLSEQPPAQVDSVSVARLRTAGGALIGRTQMTEFAFSGLGLNPHQGTPSNVAMARLGLPGRIPGGSTSGGAVSVASGAAWAALGSDTGGSIRIPAALHGLVGYKNTQSLTSNRGSMPLAPSLDTACAITNSVRDAILVHEVLAQRRVPVDISVTPTKSAVKGLRLNVARAAGLGDLDTGVSRAFDGALNTLSALGVRIDFHVLAPLAETAHLLVNGGIVGAEAWQGHAERLREHEAAYDRRVATRIRRGAATTADQLSRLHADRTAWIQAVERAMGDQMLWVMPTVPLVAPAITDLEASDDEYFRVNGLMLRNPSLVNLLDGCAITLPCHNAGEAPVGLMLWARRGQDDALLAAAFALEAVLRPSAP